MDAYVVVKWMHIVGAALLFGTGLGTAFHFWITQKREATAAIAAAARAAVLADWIFTLPAVILQPITGLALASMAGYPLGSTWIVAALVLYVVAGACWVPVVFIQLRLRAIATECTRSDAPLTGEFRRLLRCWIFLGWPAFIALAIVFWLMIARPA
jgi:uncharacterized membrane protein